MTSKPISIRLPEAVIADLEKIAGKRFLPMRTMLRAWVLDRKEREGMDWKENEKNIEEHFAQITREFQDRADRIGVALAHYQKEKEMKETEEEATK